MRPRVDLLSAGRYLQDTVPKRQNEFSLKHAHAFVHINIVTFQTDINIMCVLGTNNKK
jgi:hypothetical protein